MRHFYPMAVVCALLSGHFHTPVGAQTSERLISITESVGQEIDPAERDKYGLFAEHTGFLLAEVVSDGTQQWLRISYRRGQERLVQRSALSDADLQALRARIETHDAQVRAGLRKDVATEAEQEGRLRLVTDGFLYG